MMSSAGPVQGRLQIPALTLILETARKTTNLTFFPLDYMPVTADLKNSPHLFAAFTI
jgi:hypothetical protein